MYSYQRLKWQLIALLILSITFCLTVKISAAEDYLIVRVLDADYPPTVRASEQGDYTLFSFTLQIQIENPTQSVIEGPYVCSPIPFPHLKTNLENNSLEVFASMVLEGSIGNFSVQPGIRNQSAYFGIHVENYVNESLPLGEYELWFDFTNCSVSPIPVVTEKMYIDVTETSITYFFEFINETRVVSPTQTIEVADFELPFYVFSLLLLVRAYLKRKRRNRI